MRIRRKQSEIRRVIVEKAKLIEHKVDHVVGN